MTHDFDTLGRRSRLTATPTGQRVSPTPRDLAWFAALAEHGPLPSSFLLAFGAGSHVSGKRAVERLGDLFHEANTPDGGAYLTRPPQQFRTLDSRYNQLVYGLAPVGWRALSRIGEDAIPKRPPTGPWLHRHMVACITASIEIATRGRTDISYIPQSAILARAKTDLRYPITITDPVTRRSMRKALIPDAACGLQYHTPQGDRFRFFAVEADRATEPTTSENWNRKSFQRSLLQYHAYVVDRAYREHLKLSAPLLVLNVVSDRARMARMIDYIAKQYPAGNAFMLFQSWTDFGAVFRPPRLQSSFLVSDWSRGGLPGFRIDRP